jgi:hypothetical protein
MTYKCYTCDGTNCYLDVKKHKLPYMCTLGKLCDWRLKECENNV